MGLLAFQLYYFTGSRTIQWQDSGQFTLRIGLGMLENEWGLALVHPLHYMLGRLAMLLMPWNIPWAITAVSALGGAAAVGLCFSLTERLTASRAAALYGALTLMLAHTFWRFSGLPEVYTLSAALLLLQILGHHLLRHEGNPAWWLLILGANGLNFANHNLALLELAVWGPLLLHDLFRAKTLSFRTALAAMGCWLFGSLPYTALILGHMLHSGTILPIVYSALFGDSFSGHVLNLNPFTVHMLITFAFLGLSFPGPALPLAATAAFRRARELAVPLLLLTVHLVFVLRYPVIDQYTFIIPAMAVLALLAGLGYAGWRSRAGRRIAWALLLAQPLLYAAAPALARQAGVLSAFQRNKPYRDDAEYLFWPWTVTETSAERIAKEAVAAAAPDGFLVIEDTMLTYAIQWELAQQGLDASITVYRPSDTEEMLGALVEGAEVIWVPAVSAPAPEGWESEGEVWRNRKFDSE